MNSPKQAKGLVIASGWERYRDAVMPSTVSEVQLQETRRAFYAGAAHLLDAIVRAPEGPNVAIAIQAELKAFAVAVMDGRA